MCVMQCVNDMAFTYFKVVEVAYDMYKFELKHDLQTFLLCCATVLMFFRAFVLSFFPLNRCSYFQGHTVYLLQFLSTNGPQKEIEVPLHACTNTHTHTDL